MRRALAAAAGLTLAGALLPAPALAHGLVGKQDLPIPRWMFAWAAAVVLVASFVALATLWPHPRMQELRERVVAGVPRALDPLCGAIGVAVFAIVVYAGLAGSQTDVENLTPTFVYVILWVAIPFASFLVGDVFRAFNPWRAIARAAAWVLRRAGAGPGPEPLVYPAWLGRWPAALGILLFAWVELAYTNRTDPSGLALMGLVYAGVQLVGMSLYGLEPWLRNADPFGVYFGLFARIAPLRWRDGKVVLRAPLSGLPSLDPRPGTVALLCVMIGSTSFDGLSQGTLWTDLAPHIQGWFTGLGTSYELGLEIAYTIGLVVMVLIVAALYRIGVSGMTSLGEGHEAGELGRRFVHTLVPIALAYVIAHYFSFLIYQGQATAYLISDPLGDGSNLFGTASSTIDYGLISANGVWYVQVVALLVGHVSGLLLAHDRALVVYRRVSTATRSQYWMLAVMVAFTCLGLWLLSAAAQ